MVTILDLVAIYMAIILRPCEVLVLISLLLFNLLLPDLLLRIVSLHCQRQTRSHQTTSAAEIINALQKTKFTDDISLAEFSTIL